MTTTVHIKSYRGRTATFTVLESCRGWDIKMMIFAAPQFDGLPPHAQRVLAIQDSMSPNKIELDDDRDISHMIPSSEQRPWYVFLKAMPYFRLPGVEYGEAVSARLIQQEISFLRAPENSKPNIYELESACPSSQDFFFHLKGPEDTPYSGASFRVLIHLAESFVHIKFLTPIWCTYVTLEGQTYGQDLTNPHLLWCDWVLALLYENFKRPPKPSLHERWGEPPQEGWNEEVYQAYVKDPIQFQQKAKDWTTWFAKGIWHPSIYPSLPEAFRRDIKLFLLINHRLKGTSLFLPEDPVFLIIKCLIQDRRPLE